MKKSIKKTNRKTAASVGLSLGAKIAIVVICSVFLIGIISAAAWVTGGYTHAIETFAAEVNGTRVTKESDTTNITLPLNETVRVNIDNLFGKTDYTVSVIPADGVAFDFKADGGLCAFSLIGDVSDKFNLEKHDDYFTINTKVYTMIAFLQSVYPGKEITDVPDLTEENYFTLVISSGNETISIDLPGIVVTMMDVSGVSLNHSEIEF